MTSSEMASVRKDIETMMENIFTDPRASKQDIMNRQINVIKARSEMVSSINDLVRKEEEMEQISGMEQQIQSGQLRGKE